ncbi:MAG: hypothetical protein ACYC6A_14515 [Armatimonadota bacterium]
MDEQTRRKIYQTTSLVAGLTAVGAMLLLHVTAWFWHEFKYIHVLWSTCCYIAIVSSVTAIVAAILGKHLKPLQTAFLALAVMIIPLLLVMEQLRQGYGSFSLQTECRDMMRGAFARTIDWPDGSFPGSIDDFHLPAACMSYQSRLPWPPPVCRPVGMNVHIANVKLDAIPHPERTVCLADCLPADGRIRGPLDVDWTRHGRSGNVLLCTGVIWGPSVCKREELIFNPWPSTAPQSPSPPARSRPAPPASRRP